jgi:subtilisin family serine protease
MPYQRTLVAVIGGIAAMTLVSAGAAPAARKSPADPTAALPAAQLDALRQGQPFRTVTLITGDRISVSTDGTSRIAMAPGPRRANATFVSRMVDGHRQVIPAEAMSLLAQGKLDQRLFDVTELLDEGYDDTSSILPLIVSYPKASAGFAALRTGALSKVTIHRQMPGARMIAVRQQRSTATAAWNSLTTPGANGRQLTSGVDKIWLDGRSRLSLETSVPQIGAPTAWQAGFRGDGVTLGIIDSGVDDTHPDLVGKVVDRVDFTTENDGIDHAGHGTHVASIMVGTGAGDGGRYTGVAPNARLYSAKVCTAAGTCQKSAIIQGMEWIATHGVRVANMSLGGANAPDVDSTEAAVERLTATYGTLFVAASGNSGATVTSSPASAPSALAVGAVDRQDRIASFSSRGQLLAELAVKPEIAAPGVDIMAARGKDSPGTGTYISHSGTSMAAPHVTGAVGLLAQQHPTWTPGQLKDAVVSSAKGTAKDWYTLGAGRIDIGRAVTQPVYASPATLGFGTLSVAAGEAPVRRTVTYHNAGAGPLTLDLSLEATTAAGSALPAGLLTVSAPTVTVPAGGDASVIVTAIALADVPTHAALGGVLNATAGDVNVRTPMTVLVEQEAYTLTVTGLDRAGKPSGRSFTSVYDQTYAGVWNQLTSPTGTAAVKLPRGEYTLNTLQLGGAETALEKTLLVYPKLVLDKDTTIVMDARRGRPVSVAPPRRDAVVQSAHVGFSYGTASGWRLGQDLTADTFARMWTAQVGPDDPGKQIMADASAVLHKAGATVNSPYVYNLAWHAPLGTFFTGFRKTVRPKDLAAFRTSYTAPVAGTTANVYSYYRTSWDYARGWALESAITMPLVRDEYYLAAGDVLYDKTLATSIGATIVSWQHEPYTAFAANTTNPQRWGGVYGPGFRVDPPNGAGIPYGVSRTGDLLWILPALMADNQSRHNRLTGTVDQFTLKRNGVLTASSPSTFVIALASADEAEYEVSLSQRRPVPDVVSSQVDVVWTFRSKRVAGTAREFLPLSAVRFTPKLNLQQRAPAGYFRVPFTVQRQPGSTAGATESFGMQVSYDDGTTWTEPRYTRTGDRGVAILKNPRKPGYVSLRATATDTAGNSVQQTIMRAYRV